MRPSRGRHKALVLASTMAAIGSASAWHYNFGKATEGSARREAREAQGWFLSIALRHSGETYLDKEDPKEVTAVFLKCFKVGEEAAKYDEILKTGKRNNHGDFTY